jgi:ribose transport system substrate-binding protein
LCIKGRKTEQDGQTMKQGKQTKLFFVYSMWAVGAAMLLLLLLFIAYAYRQVDNRNPIVFGAIYRTMNNPYFESLNESIRESVEAQGDVLLTRDSAQSQERQNEQIRELIDEGVTVLFANPVDWSEIAPAMEECKKAGVAVIGLDSAIEDESGFVAEIQSDQYHAGQLIAEDMMEAYPDGARIITLYEQGIRSMVDRMTGFMDTIKGDDRYQIVGTDQEVSDSDSAMLSMNRMIRLYSNVDVVFGANDPLAIGALASIAAYRQQNETWNRQPAVYGIDGSPDAKKLIMKGEMAGSAAQYPVLMGRRAVSIAYDYLNGEEIRKHYRLQISMMTKQSIDTDNIAGWQ